MPFHLSLTLYHNYYVPFLGDSVIIILYKFIVTWWYQFGNYAITYQDMSENIVLIAVNFMVIFGGMIYARIIPISKSYVKRLNVIKDYIFYGTIEFVSLG